MADAGWYPQPDGTNRYWDGKQWQGLAQGDVVSPDSAGWHKQPDGTDGYWNGSDWESFPAGWVVQGDGSQRYWDGQAWSSGFIPAPDTDEPAVKRPDTPEERQEAARKSSATAVTFGCIVIPLAIILLLAVTWGVMKLTGNTAEDKIQEAWDSLSATQRTAMCAPVLADPDFRGTARGLEAVVNDPDVSEYQTHSFLLDVC